MEGLISVVATFVKEKFDKGTAWYNWPFDLTKVPANVSCGLSAQDDWYHRNVELKRQLHKTWCENPERRADLERYYIVVWGGVRSNKDATLTAYFRARADEAMNRGVAGIASWSKALCVRDPLSYAIFDARVSISLNVLQIIHRARIAAPVRFPLLPSRNSAVQLTEPFLKNHFKAAAWPNVRPTFYRDYLSLCRAVAELLGQPGEPFPIYAVEMALFAHTEELLRAAFPAIGRD